MMRRHIPVALAMTLGLLALILLGFQWAGQPTTLKVAVGPTGGEDARLIGAVAQALTRDHEDVRLRLVPTGSPAESAALAERGKVDLAVVRSDIGIPSSTQTVAILHRDAAVLMTTHAEIAGIPDLRGRRVGILRNPDANTRLLARILEQYDLPASSVSPVPLAGPEEAGPALREGRIDAVLAVAPPTAALMRETVASLAATGQTPLFLSVGEAPAIARRLPVLEAVEVVRGAFGGTPPRPAETVTTIGITHRLVAQAKLADAAISELSRLIFVVRPAVATDLPLANQIEAPDTSKSASLPVHPGAQAYYDGEIETFFERYGDWFYLAVMTFSIAGSAAATLVSRAANRSRARDMELLRELLTIVRTCREADGEEALSALEREADEILGVALARAGLGAIDNAGVAAFTLGLDQARRAITERRTQLLERQSHAGDRNDGPAPGSVSAAAE